MAQAGGSKGSSALSGAASGASAGASFGPWGAAIGAIAGGLFGAASGGGKTASVLNGFDVSGNASKAGFSGTVTAFDQQGNRWAASLAAVDPVAREELSALPDGVTVPVSFRAGAGTPEANQLDVVRELRDGLKRFTSSSTVQSILGSLGGTSQMQAPEIAMSSGSITGAGAAGSVASNAPAPTVIAELSANPLLLLAVVGAFVWFIGKKG